MEISYIPALCFVNDSFKTHLLGAPSYNVYILTFRFTEQCEEWEKMADRANSLRIELADVRELLVDWKKMEVR